VLLTYPGNPIASPVLRRFAEEEGVPIADVEPELTRRIEKEGRDRYLIPDGHCNDRGYAVMAEQVGRLLRHLPPPDRAAGADSTAGAGSDAAAGGGS
jgi:hypothetical protein